MKNKKTIGIIVGLSAFALIGLVVIQLRWIKQATELKEADFDHRVNMALIYVVHKLSDEERICKHLKQSINSNTIIARKIRLEDFESKAKVDTLISKAFRYHNIDIPYKYTIIKHNNDQSDDSEVFKASYKKSLEQAVKHSDVELIVQFPNKQKFVLSQMSLMLVGSVVFILLITACFAVTITTIFRQKKLAEMTTDFINNMTHELKTPIATISLASNMLRKDKVTQDPCKIKRYSDVIHDENYKLKEQVERILDYARLERGEFNLRKEQIDIHKLIKDSINVIELQVAERKGQIQTQLDATQHTLQVDEVHFTNIISNLLDNANKYSPEAPQITVSTRNEDEGLVIAVEDKGIGMNKSKQKQIFNKFYRVPTGNLHDVKGFGLGLSYVKMMVEAHGGEVRLKSEPNCGSKFEVFIPAV
ncbi:HAMP domain-containing sensor histidine kinase [Rapidithrix thailandica]|uniref:histidine kinase n=1 Tax=Rapidithrix thailandica TaxID=413964 RepID=A0AAW9SJ01_9BACT